MERSVEIPKDVHLWFTDFKKAFDKVKHNESLHLQYDIRMDNKDLKIIQNVYYQQSSKVHSRRLESDTIPTEKGARQGCVHSPGLHNLKSECNMRSCEEEAKRVSNVQAGTSRTFAMRAALF